MGLNDVLPETVNDVLPETETAKRVFPDAKKHGRFFSLGERPPRAFTSRALDRKISDSPDVAGLRRGYFTGRDFRERSA